MGRSLLASLFVIVLGGSIGHAQSAALGVNSLQSSAGSSSILDKLSVSAAASTTTNAVQLGSQGDVSASTLTVTPIYEVNKTTVAGLSISGSQYHDESQITKFNNTALFVQTTLAELSLDTSISGSVSLLLPTDNFSNKESSLQTSATAGASLTHKTLMLKLPTILSTGASLTRNAHGFERTSADSANIMQVASFSGSSSMTYQEKVTLTLVGSYSMAETYQGTVKGSFSLSQKLSYSLNKKSTVALGHSNAAAYYKADGSTNISAFDAQSSSFTASLSHSF